MDGDIQLERADDGERTALTLFAAISTGASFTPVHEAEAGWIISSHVISRCNVRCRVFEIVCPAPSSVPFAVSYSAQTLVISSFFPLPTARLLHGFCIVGNNHKRGIFIYLIYVEECYNYNWREIVIKEKVKQTLNQTFIRINLNFCSLNLHFYFIQKNFTF